MKQKLIRRNFVRQGLALSAGVLLARPLLKAQNSEIDAVTGPTKKSEPETQLFSALKKRGFVDLA